MPRCGAKNKPGSEHRYCHNPVTVAGEKCWRHRSWWQSYSTPTVSRTSRRVAPPPAYRQAPVPRGRPPSRPRSPKPPPPPLPPARKYYALSKAERDRVDRAAAFVIDIIPGNWPDKVADRLKDAIDDKDLERELFGRGRIQGMCKRLANIAQEILKTKKLVHKTIGSIAGWFTQAIGGEPLEVAIVKKLAEKMPIPAIDAKAIAAARGCQVVGIMLCLREGKPLRKCQCFIDLALAESKERVGKIVSAALEDWTAPGSKVSTDWTAPPTPRVAV